jgi:hypothetical protein
MAGYLDQYGAGVDQRLKIIKILILSGVGILIATGIALFIFHNYRQEQQVKHFFELVESHDYQSAYNMWVRTDVDRRGYPFTSFLQDWGPQSDHPDVSRFRITKSRSCGSGVILTVDFDGSKQEKLWVERKDLTIGFSPLPGCPAPRS